MSIVRHPKCYVVLGPGHGKNAGKIKSIPLSTNIHSPIIEFREGQRRPRIREKEEDMGTVFLDDLFRRHGMRREWAAWLELEKRIAAGQQVKREQGKTAFPDHMLPPEVLQWRKDQGQPEGLFDVEEYANAPEPDHALPDGGVAGLPLPGDVKPHVPGQPLPGYPMPSEDSRESATTFPGSHMGMRTEPVSAERHAEMQREREDARRPGGGLHPGDTISTTDDTGAVKVEQVDRGDKSAPVKAEPVKGEKPKR